MERDSNPNININFIQLIENVELYIKLTNNISIPAIILEHRTNDNLNFNSGDLKQLYEKFGNILVLINKGKKNIVLFKTFLSAYICKLFLEKRENYKIDIYNNFHVRWFDLNKDIHLIPNNDKELFINISNKNMLKMNVNNNNNNTNNNDINIGVKMGMNLNIDNINMNMINNQIHTGNILINPQIGNNMDNLNIFSFDRNNFEYNNIHNINNIMGMQGQNIMDNNIINMYNNMNANNLNNMNNNNINLNAFNNTIYNIDVMNNYNNNNFNNNNFYNNTNIINNINNINNLNIFQNNYNRKVFIRNNPNNNIKIKNLNMFEDKVSGKFTCKYEILIENEPEFQVAKKLIGSKGYNMKHIINECKIDGEKDIVKLRLRGRGSGYKEGPQNVESDEPLHLCVSSKTKEQLNKACFLVNKLFDKIYEEYKNFCKKSGKTLKIEKIGRKMEN